MIQSVSAAAAQLVHLSGPERGRTRRVFGTTHLVPLEGGRLKLVYGQPRVGEQPIAALVADNDGWYLDVHGDTEAWVNGTRAGNRSLHAGDLIEIGDRMLLRFRPRVAGAAYKSVREAFNDCLGCAKLGGHGTLDRIGILVLGPARELATQVRPAVRAAFLLGAFALVAGLGMLWTRDARLGRELSVPLEGVEGLVELFAASERAAFTINDYNDVRAQLDFRINDTLARIEALENRTTARGRVISEASASVVFIQGSYGFVEPRSGRALRSAGVASGDAPTVVAADGGGSPLEFRYTGTGFVLADLDVVATNRHVAMPWEFDAAAQHLIEQGFTPTMRRLVGYLPGVDEPFDLAVETGHTQADVAILRSTGLGERVAGLRLAEAPPEIGDEVLVLGYPAGIRSLLARADPTFVSSILGQDPVDFWDLAGHLARGGYVAPLATMGSIGQITAGAIVYDAETTHGGSGGPVLALDGAVVALNAAVLPEFGGSNLGVPIQRLRELLAP